MTYPYCDGNQSYMGYQNVCCNTQSMIDDVNMSRVNFIPLLTYNPLLTGILNGYEPPKPKSGRKVFRDLGDSWIAIAHGIGMLKLLEIELK